MIKQLLEEVFEKAGKQTGNTSKNGRAKHLETIFSEDYRTPISAKSLVSYLEGKSEPRMDLRMSMLEYLGYKDFEDYVNNSVSKKNDVHTYESKNKFSFYKWAAAIASIGILGVLFFGKTGREYLGENFGDCMYWDGNKYRRAFCIGEMQELDKLALHRFHEIKVCDTTTFFKNYKPIIWYDKTNNQVSYFTHYGLHPTNGKTLKPITEEIINSHVKSCD